MDETAEDDSGEEDEEEEESEEEDYAPKKNGKAKVHLFYRITYLFCQLCFFLKNAAPNSMQVQIDPSMKVLQEAHIGAFYRTLIDGSHIIV